MHASSFLHTTNSLPIAAAGVCMSVVAYFGYWFSSGVPMADG
ncbi:hypothetical protein [Vreelandella nanhaiensis]|nr:hypothetical protein [Halomonas nanhaiensis]